MHLRLCCKNKNSYMTWQHKHFTSPHTESSVRLFPFQWSHVLFLTLLCLTTASLIQRTQTCTAHGAEWVTEKLCIWWDVLMCHDSRFDCFVIRIFVLPVMWRKVMSRFFLSVLPHTWVFLPQQGYQTHTKPHFCVNMLSTLCWCYRGKPRVTVL